MNKAPWSFLLISSLLFLVLESSRAQNTESIPSVMYFAVEASAPVADFNKTANLGLGLGAQIGASVGNRWGLNVAIKHFVWGAETDEMEKIQKTVNPQAEVFANGWRSTTLMLGPYIVRPLNPEYTMLIYFRGLLGMAYTQSPEYSVYLGPNGGSNINIPSLTAIGPSAQFGVDLRYDFNPYLSFTAFSSVYGALTTFQSDTNPPAYLSPDTPGASEKIISAVNFGIGLGWLF